MRGATCVGSTRAPGANFGKIPFGCLSMSLLMRESSWLVRVGIWPGEELVRL